MPAVSLEPVAFSKRQEPQPRLTLRAEPGRRAERWWTPAEDAIIRETYPDGGLGACLDKLTGRSPGAIYGRANKLGVKSTKQAGGPRKRHPAAPEIDAKIREAWPTLADKGAVQRFADALGVDRWIISKRATAMGLTRAHRRKEPNWTEAEDALLRRAPLNRPDKAATMFKEHGFARTATAITVRATRLQLSRRPADFFSARGAAEVLGVDAKWITARCIDGSLEAEKRGTKRLVQQGGDTWSIEPGAFRRFVLRHLEEIDIRKVEKFAFVALLAEPPTMEANQPPYPWKSET